MSNTHTAQQISSIGLSDGRRPFPSPSQMGCCQYGIPAHTTDGDMTAVDTSSLFSKRSARRKRTRKRVLYIYNADSYSPRS